MPYTYNTPAQQDEMLAAIGAASIDELFSSIPASMQLKRALDLPPALGEIELTAHMQELARQNTAVSQSTCFMGAGSYDHFVPAVIDTLASRGEFYTSYTPYQPEVSQGNLQVMFEYQTLICQLTGMDVSNASLYDGGSAAVEAMLMAISITRRSDKVVVLEAVHPEYRQIIETYFATIGTEVITVSAAEQLQDALDDQTAAVLVQSPNFFGNVEDLTSLAEQVHAAGALLVCSVDPISLGILKRPGDAGVDIVVAEGQSLGTPLLYGGPYLGIMACREEFVRRLPGRIAGQTVDQQGNRCWVLTLQTREQHIRREKATSNICTNQGLFALRAAIYLSVMGPEGMGDVADLCLQKAHYAQQQLTNLDRFEAVSDRPFFKEFVIRDKENDVNGLLQKAEDFNLLAGVALGRWYPELEDCLLIAVTEKRTKDEINQLVEVLGS
ncbi:MAG: aminomethyl-transferring glycine dehydrogenase [Planctomycetaceae bacterium]|nr:aminomethyl-transferring glycine dehydrogenase [Planctomycetaceae bacterium]|tara:strand:- start:10 stop:1332 length:1323 start_codon:yes stop_codon:yes gene_type:complete